MKKFSIIIGLLVLSRLAVAGPIDGLGDETGPFPLACMNFSGSWMGESGSYYNISQKRCYMLRINATTGSSESSTTIVPDNKSRNVASGEWSGQVRHKWNSSDYGTALETYRTMFFENEKVSEVVIVELVNDNLLLESVYRTIEPNEGKKRQEISQQVFRRKNRYYQGK